MKTNNLKPDKNQPRGVPSDFFRSDEGQTLADSIKTHGIINPIEVDDKGVIVTGELRWRVAKALGLKELPVKVLTEKEIGNRRSRQAHENLVRNEFSSVEERALAEWAYKKAGSEKAGAKLIGVPLVTFQDWHFIVKEYAREGTAGGTLDKLTRKSLVYTRTASPKHRTKLQEAAAEGDWPREEVQAKASVLTEDIDAKTADQIINQPVTKWSDVVRGATKQESSFSKQCIEFIRFLNAHPSSGFPKATNKAARSSITLVEGAIKDWRRD